MNTIKSFFLFLFLSPVVFGQTTGYFGKKNLVEFGITVNSPMLYNFYATTSSNSVPYLVRNGNLQEKTSPVNYGFRLSVGRVIERNTALYLETGLSYFSVVPENFLQNSSGSQYVNMAAEMLDIQGFSIMPKIEFTSNDGLLPIGITNQFGVGMNYYKTLEKEYIGTADTADNSTGYYVPVNITKDNYYDYSTKAIKGYSFMYKLTMRIPINDKLLYHFGFRYTCNLVPRSYNHSTSSDDAMNQVNMWYSIKHKENRNLINFETGIAYSF